MDWNRQRYKPVLCEFRPRTEYNGNALKPGLLEKSGTRFMLYTLWLMDESDPYPGEYALSTFRSSWELCNKLGIGWVASGDVVVLDETNSDIKK